jgi:hypothetical protein
VIYAAYTEHYRLGKKFGLILSNLLSDRMLKTTPVKLASNELVNVQQWIQHQKDGKVCCMQLPVFFMKIIWSLVIEGQCRKDYLPYQQYTLRRIQCASGVTTLIYTFSVSGSRPSCLGLAGPHLNTTG